jgi:hypothetical protein
VVYAPTLSVAGLRNLCSADDLRGMLCGELPTASSQLEVTRPFVLRHIHKGLGAEVLDRTLKSNQRRGAAPPAAAPPAAAPATAGLAAGGAAAAGAASAGAAAAGGAAAGGAAGEGYAEASAGSLLHAAWSEASDWLEKLEFISRDGGDDGGDGDGDGDGDGAVGDCDGGDGGGGGGGGGEGGGGNAGFSLTPHGKVCAPLTTHY